MAQLTATIHPCVQKVHARNIMQALTRCPRHTNALQQTHVGLRAGALTRIHTEIYYVLRGDRLHSTRQYNYSKVHFIVQPVFGETLMDRDC